MPRKQPKNATKNAQKGAGTAPKDKKAETSAADLVLKDTETIDGITYNIMEGKDAHTNHFKPEDKDFLRAGIAAWQEKSNKYRDELVVAIENGTALVQTDEIPNTATPVIPGEGRKKIGGVDGMEVVVPRRYTPAAPAPQPKTQGKKEEKVPLWRQHVDTAIAGYQWLLEEVLAGAYVGYKYKYKMVTSPKRVRLPPRVKPWLRMARRERKTEYTIPQHIEYLQGLTQDEYSEHKAAYLDGFADAQKGFPPVNPGTTGSPPFLPSQYKCNRLQLDPRTEHLHRGRVIRPHITQALGKFLYPLPLTGTNTTFGFPMGPPITLWETWFAIFATNERLPLEHRQTDPILQELVRECFQHLTTEQTEKELHRSTLVKNLPEIQQEILAVAPKKVKKTVTKNMLDVVIWRHRYNLWVQSEQYREIYAAAYAEAGMQMVPPLPAKQYRFVWGILSRKKRPTDTTHNTGKKYIRWMPRSQVQQFLRFPCNGAALAITDGVERKILRVIPAITTHKRGKLTKAEQTRLAARRKAWFLEKEADVRLARKQYAALKEYQAALPYVPTVIQEREHNEMLFRKRPAILDEDDNAPDADED